jgi:hypothetical protein
MMVVKSIAKICKLRLRHYKRHFDRGGNLATFREHIEFDRFEITNYLPFKGRGGGVEMG